MVEGNDNPRSKTSSILQNLKLSTDSFNEGFTAVMVQIQLPSTHIKRNLPSIFELHKSNNKI